MISIVDCEDCHQQYFEQFNRRWIEQYFEMEAGTYKRADVKMMINLQYL